MKPGTCKAIIFDLDQTLVDRDATLISFLHEQYRRFATSFSGVEEQEFVSFVKSNDNNGYTPKSDLYAIVCQEYRVKVPIDIFLKDFREHYGKRAVLLPDVREVIETLSQNYKLAIITNGRSKGQRAKIESTGIEGFFSSIKVSEEEGIKKPDPKFYHSCLDELGFEASDCVFVGDHPLLDVEGAQSVGMKAIWLKNEHFPQPDNADWVVDDLRELANIFLPSREKSVGNE